MQHADAADLAGLAPMAPSPELGPSAYPAEHVSPSMTIGKHEWRLVTYWGKALHYDEASGKWNEHEQRYVAYEWRPKEDGALGPDDWQRDVDWPRYDSDNGQTAGLPATLRKLWDQCPWAHERKTRTLEREAA